MLLIGTPDIFLKIMDRNLKLDLFNFTSLRENFGKELHLYPYNIPDNQIGFIRSDEFDQWYANFILFNDMLFSEFMNVAYSLFSGSDVFIAVRRTDLYEILTESLTKLIQTRYGYCAQQLYEVDDLNINDESDFSYFGLKTFDQDLSRYLNLFDQSNH